jgi:broad specificity phosphatase PhoE
MVAGGPDAQIEPELAEWEYGDYEGLRTAEIRQTRPDWNLFRDGCPHGESPAQVSARADRVVARLRTFEGNVVLFSHGHFCRVLAARWAGWPASAAENLLFGTVALGILGFEHDDISAPAIALWNDGPGAAT